ncbi:50S ribosomal protein L24 [Patescibacteria group bacterium]|nr:50S ribosomal protein L24 [Patescibacteria group bacterium]
MTTNKLGIKKGDKVQVITGNYRGKQGVVERALPKERKVVVSGINIVKRHMKPRGQQKPGGIIEITKPIDVSKVMFVCPSCSQKTRIGYDAKGKEKHRICKKCGKTIS